MSGKVTFLWDSIDDVYKLYNQIVLNLMTYIQKRSENSQIICTRPIYSRNLEETFSTQSYKLTFVESNQNIFLKRFLKSRVAPEKLNETINTVENLMKNLEKNAKYEPDDRKLDIPLMLNFIAEAFIGNNSLGSSDIYEVYQIIFDKMIKLFEDNCEFIGNYFTSNLRLGFKFSLREIYQKYALKTIFSEMLNLHFNKSLDYQNLTMENIQSLQILKIQFPQRTLYAEISHMQILYINSEFHFRFLHKTFAEFFVAQYFLENIFLDDENSSFFETKLRAEMFLFVKSMHGTYNLHIIEFMKDFLQNCNNVSKYCDIISSFLSGRNLNNFKNFPNMFWIFGSVF